MKSSISFIGLVTLCLLSTVQSDNQNLPKTVIVDKQAILEIVNNDRRAYAKERGITNMHKLIWDENLAQLARNRDSSSDKKTMRAARIDGDEYTEEQAQKYRKHYNETTLQELLQDYNRYHMIGMETLIPGQKKIGCAPKHVESSQGLITNTLCFLGPEGNGDSFTVSRGSPGSKCSNGYNNEDGLCALPAENNKKTENTAEAARLIGTTEEPVDNGSNQYFSYGFLVFSVIFVVLRGM
ncbi:hypothetical protein CRE_21820 [Caenorhabditis remanei]|uniref:SCP domain-containing protein n=1 Tax=Caenorhabditis remanei TaxID=31234 RepID=E3MEM9_CAERE|nr:hypothetical protein CRE_21820 [Caenorhabditis remanei]